VENYIPDIYKQNIYGIDYQKLLNKGIKCLIFDLDNTLEPAYTKMPGSKLKKLIESLKNKGFKIIILSNSIKARVRNFGEALDIPYYANACKPKTKKFLTILSDYNFSVNEVAMIGDQILTDILGGNRVGITTVLVTPLSNKELIFTKVNRAREKLVMKKLRDKNLFSKGRYYDL
jgi:HAD superfamily phosphatase (TIGR01668 family)